MKRNAQRLPNTEDLLYPESDGKPMAETDDHRDIMSYLIEALKLWFRKLLDVYVSGNLMFYYVEGDPYEVVSPDVFVVKGVPRRRRRVYRLWLEGASPCVVIEVTSRKTRSEDTITKFELYRDVLRVREYYLYDPQLEHVTRRLKAYELRGRRYVERPVKGGRIESEELGLVLAATERGLRLIDPSTGAELPDLAAADDARAREAAGRAEAEAGRAQAEAARAQAEAARAQEAAGRSQEAAARAAAEEEVRRLAVELERLRRTRPTEGP
ncbi:MAG: Uma2 family endonuclease [Planctomycetes bacterium]|nr:Uma2 family endonuclease [Planctomycetota bacterium]